MFFGKAQGLFFHAAWCIFGSIELHKKMHAHVFLVCFPAWQQTLPPSNINTFQKNAKYFTNAHTKKKQNITENMLQKCINCTCIDVNLALERGCQDAFLKTL